MARDAAKRPLRGALLAGLVVGASTLVRPPSIACAPALALIAFAAAPRALRLRRAALVAVIATAAALLVVAPWTLRNCRTMDGCALVSTNAGWNLAIGSFPRATGRFETLRASDGCPVVTGQVQQDRCWAAEGWRWIRNEPSRYLSLIPKKLGYTFDHESYPVGYLAEADPEGWPEHRRSTARGLLTGTHRLLLCVAALAFVRSPRHGRRWRVTVETGLATFAVTALALLGFLDDRHPFWPVALMLVALAAVRWRDARSEETREGVLAYCAFLVAATLMTSAVFFGEDRYHIVVTPVLCILAACAFTSPGERTRPRPTQTQTQTQT
jgi:4-amino-4-deoxy-L-arabinose transferase-like glycosyltransferase